MSNFKPRYDYWDRKSKYAKAMSPGEVLPEIKEYVNAELEGFGSKDVGIYVGITGDPDKRFKAHQNKIVADGYTEWDEMVVVYCSSLGDVIQVENAMINYFNAKDCYKDIKFNSKGGIYENTRTYALYLLVPDLSSVNLPAGSELLKDSDDKYVSYWPVDRCTGHYSSIKNKLKSTLKKYAQGQPNIYVGITNDPHRRLGEHFRNKDVEGLIVLYETSSLDYIVQAETDLIPYTQSLPMKCENVKSGIMEAYNHFYVYLLFDRGKT